jgi:hypothetical protein
MAKRKARQAIASPGKLPGLRAIAISIKVL